MAQVLTVFELAQQDCMPQMQIGRGRIETRFHPERAALASAQQNTLAKVLLADQFGKALADIGELLVESSGHRTLIVEGHAPLSLAFTARPAGLLIFLTS